VYLGAGAAPPAIPHRVYNICREWFEFGATATPPVWRLVGLRNGINSDIGVPSPVFGKVTSLTITTDALISTPGHSAGVLDFIPYNKTTGGPAPQTGAPLIENLDPVWNHPPPRSAVAWGDGLAVNLGDEIQLYVLAENAGANLEFAAVATFVIEEQSAYAVTGTLSPDATGVVVRNGQEGDLPAFGRVDGAQSLWWDGSTTWTLSAVKGTAGASYWTRVDPNPVGSYTAAGTATGTATVANYVP